ncbi:MAG: hypothetical protein ACC633_10425 [Anaerolineales bacterium]
MIWYTLILSLTIGGLVGIFTRNLRKALKVALFTFIAGVVLSVLIILSGVLGG